MHYSVTKSMSKDKKRTTCDVVLLSFTYKEEIHIRQWSSISLVCEYRVPFFIDIYRKDTIWVRAAWSFRVKSWKIGLISRQIPRHKVVHLKTYILTFKTTMIVSITRR